MLDEERLAAVARARELEKARTQEAEQERERLRQAAIESRAQDERVLQLARADVLGALALAAELGKTVREVGLELTRRTTERDDQGRMKVATKDLLTLLTRHSQMMARAVAAAQVVLDLSRLDQGKPTAILGVQPTPQLSLEEAMMELQEAEALLREAQDGRLQLPRAQHPRHGTTVVDAEVVA